MADYRDWLRSSKELSRSLRMNDGGMFFFSVALSTALHLSSWLGFMIPVTRNLPHLQVTSIIFFLLGVELSGVNIKCGGFLSLPVFFQTLAAHRRHPL